MKMKDHIGKLNYYGNTDLGKKTIIFIPGTLISPQVFEKVCIPEGFQAVYISWMDSDGSHDVREVAKQLAAMIEEMRPGPVILAGYSSGGTIAILTYLALKKRSVIRGMLLSNTGPNVRGHSNEKSGEELMASWNREALDAFIRKCFVKPLDQKMYDALMKYGEGISARTRVEPLLSQREVDLTEQLAEISCPVILAHGKLDKIRTLDHAMQMKNGIPNSELFLLDAGHSPMYETPETYSRLLKQLADQS